MDCKIQCFDSFTLIEILRATTSFADNLRFEENSEICKDYDIQCLMTIIAFISNCKYCESVVDYC